MNRVQRSSPLLFLALAQGEHINSAIVSLRKAGSNVDFYKMTLSNVFVESVQHSASEGSEEDTPTESVSLFFQKVDYEYRAQLRDGTYSEWVKFIWDLAFNKEVGPGLVVTAARADRRERLFRAPWLEDRVVQADGSFLSPDERTRSWPEAGPEPA